jgi:anti-sigma factor ChrR (cupin superfamily)
MAEGSSRAATEMASSYLDVAGLPWIEQKPGMRMKILYRDPAGELLTILTRLDPGAGIPEHVHEDLEQTYVIEGSLVDHEGECKAGNFVIRPKGSRHAPVAPNGCTMLVFFQRPTAALKKFLAQRG